MPTRRHKALIQSRNSLTKSLVIHRSSFTWLDLVALHHVFVSLSFSREPTHSCEYVNVFYSVNFSHHKAQPFSCCVCFWSKIHMQKLNRHRIDSFRNSNEQRRNFFCVPIRSNLNLVLLVFLLLCVNFLIDRSHRQQLNVFSYQYPSDIFSREKIETCLGEIKKMFCGNDSSLSIIFAVNYGCVHYKKVKLIKWSFGEQLFKIALQQTSWKYFDKRQGEIFEISGINLSDLIFQARISQESYPIWIN